MWQRAVNALRLFDGASIVVSRHVAGRDFRLFEWVSTLAMLGVGLTLVASSHSLDRSAFALMLNGGLSQASISGIFLAAGVIRAVALHFNGSWPHLGPKFRIAAAVVGISMWAQMAIALLEFRPHPDAISPSVGVFFALAVGELISCYRAAHDGRK